MDRGEERRRSGRRVAVVDIRSLDRGRSRRQEACTGIAAISRRSNEGVFRGRRTSCGLDGPTEAVLEDYIAAATLERCEPAFGPQRPR